MNVPYGVQDTSELLLRDFVLGEGGGEGAMATYLYVCVIVGCM